MVLLLLLFILPVLLVLFYIPFSRAHTSVSVPAECPEDGGVLSHPFLLPALPVQELYEGDLSEFVEHVQEILYGQQGAPTLDLLAPILLGRYTWHTLRSVPMAHT